MGIQIVLDIFNVHVYVKSSPFVSAILRKIILNILIIIIASIRKIRHNIEITAGQADSELVIVSQWESHDPFCVGGGGQWIPRVINQIYSCKYVRKCEQPHAHAYEMLASFV